jgi:hypothetical protein
VNRKDDLPDGESEILPDGLICRITSGWRFALTASCNDAGRTHAQHDKRALDQKLSNPRQSWVDRWMRADEDGRRTL